MKFKYFDTINLGGYFHQVRTVHIGYKIPININKFFNKKHEAGKIVVSFKGYNNTIIDAVEIIFAYDRMYEFNESLKAIKKEIYDYFKDIKPIVDMKFK